MNEQNAIQAIRTNAPNRKIYDATPVYPMSSENKQLTVDNLSATLTLSEEYKSWSAKIVSGTECVYVAFKDSKSALVGAVDGTVKDIKLVFLSASRDWADKKISRGDVQAFAVL